MNSTIITTTTIIIVSLFLLFNNCIVRANEETICCRLGEASSIDNGHCTNINTSTIEHVNQYVICQLTAKLCCIRHQQKLHCSRIAEELFDTESIELHLINVIRQRDGNYIDVDTGKIRQTIETISNGSMCINKRNNDASCCIGCNLGILSALEHVSHWTDTMQLDPLVVSNLDRWCQSNVTERIYGKMVTDSIGFSHCCRETFQMIHQTIRWCDRRPAPCSHRCHESIVGMGQIQCSCYDGYRLSESDRTTCVDIDECQELTHDCDRQHEQCHNINGTFQCLARHAQIKTDNNDNNDCQSGYYYNVTESRCKDFDECRFDSHDCNLSSQVCRNLLGSYLCIDIGDKCPGGFRQSTSTNINGAPINCVDIDECKENSFDCSSEREMCENYIGSYTCEEKLKNQNTKKANKPESSIKSDPTNCPMGYHFVRFSFQCEDIDECRIGQHQCNLTRTKCVNFPGSYSCVTLPGYGLRNDTLMYRNVTNERNKSKFNPSCMEGFEMNDELGICEDINECKQLNSPCPSMSICHNLIGRFECHCKIGFEQNPETKQCEDVDECRIGLHACYGNLRCRNTIGSYECSMNMINDNETLDKIKLLNEQRQTETTTTTTTMSGNINERDVRCKPNERIINGNCHPIDCGTGFFYNSTESRCQDVNECLDQRPPCSSIQKCTNTIGSYRCTVRCDPGYRSVANGNGCEDLDECSIGAYRCPPNQVCKNIPGGYVCQCAPGYHIQYGKCVDVDECKSSNDSICNDHRTEKCINTPGSYRCECKEGFVHRQLSNGRMYCSDIDECADSSINRCDHTCYNYEGSYKCSCKSGYQLQSDGRTCLDIDECMQSIIDSSNNRSDLCYYECVNVPGSFRCRCPPGYDSISGGRICKDIDECEMDNVCQAQNEYCLNVRGSYRCNVINCPNGYYLMANSRKCILHLDGIDTMTIEPNQSLSYSYNFLSLVSNIRIPTRPGYLDLLAMSGPVFAITGIRYELELVNATSGKDDVRLALRDDFILRRPEYNRIIVSLIRPLTGPQDVELQLTVSLFDESPIGGTTKANIHLVVSEYEF